MGVSAAEAKGAGRGTAGAVFVHAPLAWLGIDVKWAVGECDPRVGGGVVERGRDLPMLQGQQDLEHAGYTRGQGSMADVGLHGAESTVCLFVGIMPERPGQGFHLDGIAQNSAR